MSVGDTVIFTYKATINLPTNKYATDEFVDDLSTRGRLLARGAVIEILSKNYPGVVVDVEDVV